MRSAVLVTPLVKTIPFVENAIYVGVDAGVLTLLEQEFPVEFAVGDFDSMSQEAYEKIESLVKIEKHPIMKDESDAQLALRLVKERGCSPIYLCGALSKRIDHTIANLRLLMYHYPDLILWDEKQNVRLFQTGRFVLENMYKNVSFFAVGKATITLEGFLYPLEHREINVSDIYTLSNSIVDQEGVVIVEDGAILCVMSDE